MTFNEKGDILLSSGKHVACMGDIREPWRTMVLDERRTLTVTDREEIGGHMIAMWTRWMRQENR